MGNLKYLNEDISQEYFLDALAPLLQLCPVRLDHDEEVDAEANVQEILIISADECKNFEDDADHGDDHPRQSVTRPRLWAICRLDEECVDNDADDQDDFQQAQYDDSR